MRTRCSLLFKLRFLFAVVGAAILLATTFSFDTGEAFASGAIHESIFDTEQLLVGLEQLPITTVEPRERRRPVPISDVAGKSYDELLFYPNPAGEPDTRDLEEIFNNLPAGKVVRNQAQMWRWAHINGQKFGVVETVNVSDMHFDEALRATVNLVPQFSFNYQIMPNNLVEGTDFRPGDVLLIVVYMRTITTISEDGLGRIQFIVEDTNPPHRNSLQAETVTIAGEGWQRFYLPFRIQSGHIGLRIRLGYACQTVEIGGFELINYGNEVNLEDLPATEGIHYDGRAVFDRDQQWRIDAWDRIEEIRKGDIIVLVQDVDGNPIANANVNINMFEHEFQWGTAINLNLLSQNSTRYRAAISSLFNSGVIESHHKWNLYETDQSVARNMVDAARSLNLNNIRGHALILDRAFPNGWTNNSWTPMDVYDLFTANDRVGLNDRIRDHIMGITGDFTGELVDWDVVNEVLENNAIRTKYGNDVLIDWFAWARQGDPSAKLYINETGILGRSQFRLNQLKEVLDYMAANNADYDGIGIQGHFGDVMSHPARFYDDLVQLARYGKEMKITEFDMGLGLSRGNRAYEASFVRDIMIVAFSQENVNGFYMWGFVSSSHWLDNAPIFNADWTLKESGRQFIDLVYNKWWTQENGLTATDGRFITRGFYGDYDVTVIVDDITTVVEARIYKGRESTIIVTLPVTQDEILVDFLDFHDVPTSEFSYNPSETVNPAAGLSLLMGATGVCTLAVASKCYTKRRK